MLKILAILYGWADWFKFNLVRNPKDRFSCDKAQLIMLWAFASKNNCKKTNATSGGHVI